jgi:hypothetical protein
MGSPGDAMNKSTIVFNRELLFGECGALMMASPAASIVSHYTTSTRAISFAAVAGTLAGGALFWLAARIYDSTRNRHLDTKVLASDIGYFTPAAIILGFLIYDPSIYLASHHLLVGGDSVMPSVLIGQGIAFLLFVLCMNIYRILLMRICGKSL